MQINSVPPISSNPLQAESNTELLAQRTNYSSTVAGKTYNAEITASAGEYVATVPQLPEISASGMNLTLAEDNLGARIRLAV